MGTRWNVVRQIMRTSSAVRGPAVAGTTSGSLRLSHLIKSLNLQLSRLSSSKVHLLQGKTSFSERQSLSLLQPCPLSWSICRTYAKKGKDKGGKSHKKVTLSSEQLHGVVDLDRVKSDFDHVLDDLKEKFIHQLTVRTSQGVFDNLVVKTPDGNFPLIQLAQVVQKSQQLLTINMASSPQYISPVKQALAESGLNINPQQDGTSLFIPLPKVTREHRQNLAKNAKMLSEQCKKSMRDLYSKYARKIKASKEGHSSDDLIAADDMVKDLMHSMIHQVEEMTVLKQKELLGGK